MKAFLLLKKLTADRPFSALATGVFFVTSFSSVAMSGFFEPMDPTLMISAESSQEISLFSSLMEQIRSLSEKTPRVNESPEEKDRRLKLLQSERQMQRYSSFSNAERANDIAKATIYKSIIKALDGDKPLPAYANQIEEWQGKLSGEIKSRMMKQKSTSIKEGTRIEEKLKEVTEFDELLNAANDIRKLQKSIASAKYAGPLYGSQMKIFEICEGESEFANKLLDFSELFSYGNDDLIEFSSLERSFKAKSIQLLLKDGGANDLRKLYDTAFRRAQAGQVSYEQMGLLDFLSYLEVKEILPGRFATLTVAPIRKHHLQQEMVLLTPQLQQILQSLAQDVLLARKQGNLDSQTMFLVLNAYSQLAQCGRRLLPQAGFASSGDIQKLYWELLWDQRHILVPAFKMVLAEDGKKKLALFNEASANEGMSYFLTLSPENLVDLFKSANHQAGYASVALLDRILVRGIAKIVLELKESFRLNLVFGFNDSDEKVIAVGKFTLENVFSFFEKKLAEKKSLLPRDMESLLSSLEKWEKASDDHTRQAYLAIKTRTDALLNGSETADQEYKEKEESMNKDYERLQKELKPWEAAAWAYQHFGNEAFDTDAELKEIDYSAYYRPLRTQLLKTSLQRDGLGKDYTFHAYFNLGGKTHDIFVKLTIDKDKSSTAVKSYLLNGASVQPPKYLTNLKSEE